MGPSARKQTIHTEHRAHPYHKKNVSSDMISPTSPNLGRPAATPWTPEDDARLKQARKDNMNWEPIAKTYFPTKTANACRKRHERLMDKLHTTEDWDSAKLEAMEIAYYKHRERMWKIVAEEINEKWQTVESKCMEKGWKNLTSSGRSASRRGKPLDTTLTSAEFVEQDSGFVDEPSQYSASSVPRSHSSRRTGSNASSYPATPQSHYAPPPPMTQTMYPSNFQPSYQPYGHNHNQSLPNIQSLLASTTGPNPNATVTTI